MKLVKYTLNKNGTTPDYIIDGGYLPIPNGGKSPQDYDILGFSNSEIGNEEIITKTEFETYVKNSYSITFEINGKTIQLQSELDSIWNKLIK